MRDVTCVFPSVPAVGYKDSNILGDVLGSMFQYLCYFICMYM